MSIPRCPTWIAGWRSSSIGYGLRHADRVGRPDEIPGRGVGQGVWTGVDPHSQLPFSGGPGPRQLPRPAGGRKCSGWDGWPMRKRPQWCLEVASQCPQFDFNLVGAAPGDVAVERGLRQQASAQSNVRMHGSVLACRDGTFLQGLQRSAMHFPGRGVSNAFLEAWYHGGRSSAAWIPMGSWPSSGWGSSATRRRHWPGP